MANTDKIEKLRLEDSLMLETIVEKINQLIEMVEYLDTKITHHWMYHRHQEKERKKEV